jgi:hypothetical protein
MNWPGFTSNNTLIIDVDKSDFGIRSTPIEYSGRLFRPKHEMHITVLGTNPGIHLLQQFSNKPFAEQQVRQAFESTDWSYKKTNDLRLLARGNKEHTGTDKTEESIIMRLEMAGMAEFYTRLKTLGLIDGDQPVPPPHVTLYTRNCDTGIGVHSETELIKLTRAHLDMPVRAVITSI